MDDIFFDEKQDKKKIPIKKIGLVGLILLLLPLCFLLPKKEEEQQIEQEDLMVEEKTSKVMADIKGAIQNPGVYELEEGMRIIDLIQKGGGLREDADTSTINLSKVVEDQMVIQIYTKDFIAELKQKGEVVPIEKECNCPAIQNDACDSTTSSKISLTSASKEELMTISGIGESKAEDIIKYRNEVGFTTIEDLKKISGIGDSLFERIKDQVTI